MRRNVRYAGRYAVARAAANTIGRAYKSYKNYRKSRTNSRSTGQDDSKPLYGTAFTSKVAYRARRPNKRRARAARKSFKNFMKNSMKLQNPQNSLASGNFATGAALNTQQWGSLDLLNVGVLTQMVIGQLPPGFTRQQQRDFQLQLKSFSLRMYLVNTGSTNLMLDLYYITPRRDIAYEEMNEPGSPSNGRVMSNYVLLNNSGAATDDQMADPKGDPVPQATTLGWTPFMFTDLCRQFKVTRVRNVMLPPGQIFEERDTCLNKSVNLARLGTIETAYNQSLHPSSQAYTKWYLKGISRTILYRVRGFPDGTNNAGPATLTVSWDESSSCKVTQTQRTSSNAAFTGAA